MARPLIRSYDAGGAALIRIAAAGVAVVALLGVARPAHAISVVGTKIAVANSPVDLQQPGDGTSRLFVAEQGGTIRILRDGALVPTPFLELAGSVATGGERGLLGLAFHPQYAQNRRFFVNFTRASDGATVIAAFVASATFPDRADPASRRDLLVIPQPYENHNGGALRFGPDGYLYIGMGDGGNANDPGNRAQDPQELLGKMLRIDVDHGDPYAIPPDNPHAQGGGRPEIWATGLRNPWRFAFDRVTGDLYIGDVGQGAEEEIDFLPHGTGAGSNFGWRVMEGTRCTGLSPNMTCPAAIYTAPVLSYGHDKGCSVTGGVVYRGRDVPALYGRYLYADYCSGRIWSAARDASGAWTSDVLLETGHAISTIGEDAAGEVYWTNAANGAIFRLARDSSVPMAIEYYNATLGHYFFTAFPEEAAWLDAGALGGAWKRTGFGFETWTVGTGGDVADVCRFFGVPGTGPNTHFYTGFPAECAGLKVNPLWTFEALAFGMRLPQADACALPWRPVYRLYNAPTSLGDVNHRYTTDGATYATMRASGWIGEGVAFCAR